MNANLKSKVPLIFPTTGLSCAPRIVPDVRVPRADSLAIRSRLIPRRIVVGDLQEHDPARVLLRSWNTRKSGRRPATIYATPALNGLRKLGTWVGDHSAAALPGATGTPKLWRLPRDQRVRLSFVFFPRSLIFFGPARPDCFFGPSRLLLRSQLRPPSLRYFPTHLGIPLRITGSERFCRWGIPFCEGGGVEPDCLDGKCRTGHASFLRSFV